MSRWGRLALLAAAPVLLPACSCWWEDRLADSGLEPGSELGAFVDGDRGVGAPLVVNDAVFRGDAPDLCLPNFRAATGAGERNELVAFARPPAGAQGYAPHPPVAVFAAGWTGARDSVPASFRQAVPVDVQVWVLKGPFADARDDVEEARVVVEDTWRREGTGLAVGAWDETDSTADADVGPGTLHASCGGTGPALLHGNAGARFTAGRINVYVADTVDGSTSNGYTCSDGVTIVLGHQAEKDLLGHEIGHAFRLRHTNQPQSQESLPCHGGSVPCFDAENLMYAASDSRRYLTEGQTFRALLDSRSAINSVFAARPGEPIRDCLPLSPFPEPLSQASLEDGFSCPTLEKRIWPDGGFAPN